MPVDLTHPERGPAEMSGSELKTIRNRLGLSAIQLGRAFGYVGGDNTVSVTIRRYESGERPLPPWLARLAVMFDRHGVPDEWIAGAPGPQKPGRKSPADLKALRMAAGQEQSQMQEAVTKARDLPALCAALNAADEYSARHGLPASLYDRDRLPSFGGENARAQCFSSWDEKHVLVDGRDGWVVVPRPKVRGEE